MHLKTAYCCVTTFVISVLIVSATAEGTSLLCGWHNKTARFMLPWLRDGAIVFEAAVLPHYLRASFNQKVDACDKELC